MTTCEFRKLVDDAEPVALRIGHGLDALMHISQSPSGDKADAFDYVIDSLRKDFGDLWVIWERMHNATR
jgi:hypothetical protein